ncbi:unnamed protein product [Cuscuta campestris]|uniref:AB hydrolase-1 domain-containing protein n=1 Tax=Cuscuta campestris TaxID=132261 RepID=A0A484L721_9ASTE|nr:unnamed protein product [Cuscuta campestris]
MDERTTISDHVSVLNRIVSELEFIGVEIDDEDKALQLIWSLPTSYKHMQPILMYGKEIVIFTEVVAPTEEQARNPILENLRGLNLNLPPATRNPITPEMIVVNQEPIVGDNYIELDVKGGTSNLVPVVPWMDYASGKDCPFDYTVDFASLLWYLGDRRLDSDRICLNTMDLLLPLMSRAVLGCCFQHVDVATVHGSPLPQMPTRVGAKGPTTPKIIWDEYDDEDYNPIWDDELVKEKEEVFEDAEDNPFWVAQIQEEEQDVKAHEEVITPDAETSTGDPSSLTVPCTKRVEFLQPPIPLEALPGFRTYASSLVSLDSVLTSSNLPVSLAWSTPRKLRMDMFLGYNGLGPDQELSRANWVPPVLLLHGLFMAGDSWFLNSANQSLGFILADHGFDVWVGNVRGTRWSHGHVSLTEKDKDFWDWSWQELALYDLAEMTRYVYSITNSKVSIVGHSQGTIISLAALTQPNIVEMVEAAALLCPISYLDHITSTFVLRMVKMYLDEVFG